MRNTLRIRRFEEKCAELYSASKIRGFLHLYIGEEAVAVGAMRALNPDDAIVATYREHGHALICGVPATSILAEMFGKREGRSHGRGGSMHLFDAARRFYVGQTDTRVKFLSRGPGYTLFLPPGGRARIAQFRSIRGW